MQKAPKETSRPSDPTRASAFELLHAVIRRHRSLDEALDARGAGLDSRDRAAAHRIAAAVLRHTGTLDAVLEPHLRRAPPDDVRLILRLGAAQLLLLDTPPHAAVATSVALARSRGLVPFAGLVNAVLRRVAEGGRETLETLDQPRLDTPGWLWTSWGENARAIAAGHTAEAPLDLTLRPDRPAPPGGEVLPTGSVRFPAGTRVMDLPGFAEGDFWVQDAAAALPAKLLAAQPHETVADLCAAPGGKTAQLAATGASVTAVERDPARMNRLRENLARLRMEKVETVEADLLSWAPEERFDAILLDAPCSATGTIRRHPDVPFLKRPTDIATLAAQQDRMIEAAARLLKPGGRMIYAVCSLQPEEAAPRLAVAAELGLRHVPFTAAELAFLPEALTPAGELRTHPGLWADRGGLDGFYAARLVKDAT